MGRRARLRCLEALFGGLHLNFHDLRLQDAAPLALQTCILDSAAIQIDARHSLRKLGLRGG